MCVPIVWNHIFLSFLFKDGVRDWKLYPFMFPGEDFLFTFSSDTFAGEKTDGHQK